MTDLVTLDEAKAHLRIDDADSDADTSLKLAAAQDAVLTFCDAQTDPWTPETVPPRVKAAILLALGNIAGCDRGDGVYTTPERASQAPSPISDRVRDLLWDLRTPVTA